MFLLVLARAGGIEAALGGSVGPLLLVLLALTLARFAWVILSDTVVATLKRLRIGRDEPLGVACATVMGWAGVRGVVTLAAALTLPPSFPRRDFILLTAFGMILITVVVQGTTLGPVIRWTGVRRDTSEDPLMDLFAAEQAMMRARLCAVELWRATTLARSIRSCFVATPLGRWGEGSMEATKSACAELLGTLTSSSARCRRDERSWCGCTERTAPTMRHSAA